jgi:hypothetical protein
VRNSIIDARAKRCEVRDTLRGSCAKAVNAMFSSRPSPPPAPSHRGRYLLVGNRSATLPPPNRPNRPDHRPFNMQTLFLSEISSRAVASRGRPQKDAQKRPCTCVLTLSFLLSTRPFLRFSVRLEKGRKKKQPRTARCCTARLLCRFSFSFIRPLLFRALFLPAFFYFTRPLLFRFYYVLPGISRVFVTLIPVLLSFIVYLSDYVEGTCALFTFHYYSEIV